MTGGPRDRGGGPRRAHLQHGLAEQRAERPVAQRLAGFGLAEADADEEPQRLLRRLRRHGPRRRRRHAAAAATARPGGGTTPSQSEGRGRVDGTD